MRRFVLAPLDTAFVGIWLVILLSLRSQSAWLIYWLHSLISTSFHTYFLSSLLSFSLLLAFLSSPFFSVSSFAFFCLFDIPTCYPPSFPSWLALWLLFAIILGVFRSYLQTLLLPTFRSYKPCSYLSSHLSSNFIGSHSSLLVWLMCCSAPSYLPPFSLALFFCLHSL